MTIMAELKLSVISQIITAIGIGVPSMMKNPFNVFTAEPILHTNTARNKIIATRSWAAKELTEIGFTMPPSSANFVYAKPPMDCGTLYQNLRNKGILVRYFNKPVLNEYLRITIGTDEEMRVLIDAIKEEVKNAENS